MFKLHQTDSDEDVILVSEKPANELNEMTIDQAKRLVLQRDIDQESQPKQHSTTQRFSALKKAVEIKMEEEKSEGTVIKRDKKRKKELSQPGNQSCTAEMKTKKSKKEDRVKIEEACLDNGGEMKGKRKKRKIQSESLNETSSFVGDGEEKQAKKKKKKLLEDDENPVETEQSSVKEEKKHKKKKVKKSVESTQEDTREEETEGQKVRSKASKKGKKTKPSVATEESDEEKKEIKIKKKRKNGIELEIPATEVEEVIMKKMKRNIKAENVMEASEFKGKQKVQVDEDEMKRGGHAEEKKRRKKDIFTGENKSKDVKFGIKLETSEAEDVKPKKKKEVTSKERGSEQEVTAKKSEDEDEKTLKKKKNKSSKQETVAEEEEMKVRGKKRTKASVESAQKRKVQVKEEPLAIQEEEEDVQTGRSGVALRKKSKKKKTEQDAETGATKRRGQKPELEGVQEASQMDVVFLSARSGNADEITINQERRLALQMEIDNASKPDNSPKTTGLGQWGTAQFDSSEQQQKFLRLMGGFKKGLQPTEASAGGANMAMGKKAQQQLQQGLLGEFDRAHSRRMDFNSRGAGLGFTAPSNKKFSIDVNVCRSVRFDD